MKNQRIEHTEEQSLGLIYQMRQKYGVVGDTDSYKLSHAPQYPKGTDKMVSYFASRGGEYDRVMNFGMELMCKEFLLQKLTADQVKNMIAWAKEHMMENMADDLEIALMAVVNELDGRLPIRIRNAKEGVMIPVKNVIFTIETTIADERFFSLVSYFETKLVRNWGPATVATVSFHVRELIMDYLEKSSDDPMSEIAFKFHDFGSRGVGDYGVSAFHGAGHLVSFLGTDNIAAVHAVEFAYGMTMAGFSIPASEHSTTTMHGVDGEEGLVDAMFSAYAKPDAIFATVADSYDIINFIRNIAPTVKDRLIASGATWVVRPDSNDPVEMPVQTIIELDKVFGSEVNSKGYKVLKNVRCIQGDGIEPKHIKLILDRLIELGYSASNIAFGMGGGLLQKVNRDTCKFALKCSAARVNGEWIDVYKDPATYDEEWNKVDVPSFKTSMRGRLELMFNAETGEYATKQSTNASEFGPEWEEALETIYEDGFMIRATPFDEIRRNAGTF